ncbi:MULTISPECIES: metallophosphoesterase [unclassified Aureispira]|uniref:metallophosphoesterase n=1 Tax=unclassified Aureispira TaxID=2649989 RepID=UPI000695E5FC|nr:MULTISPECIES: metallophosphoesterase [unclassified Aureispira]WMX14907.1 metallophosphoesterase [Aureispira sp. CCB-E]
MKIWATSDLHVDYSENWNWFMELSEIDYQEDILIVAGDIIPDLKKTAILLESLVKKFWKVFFVPGNHDVWLGKKERMNSLEKFHQLLLLAEDLGVQTTPFVSSELSIVPIFSWYDYSFGQPSVTIKRAWVDYKACKWTKTEEELTNYFLGLNEPHLNLKSNAIISFSHFVPSKDLIPPNVPKIVKALLPVFGSSKIEKQLQQLGTDLHVYGHSHLNRSVQKNGIWYLNNAFGYPHEQHICRKVLLPIYEDGAVIKGIEQWPTAPKRTS